MAKDKAQGRKGKRKNTESDPKEKKMAEKRPKNLAESDSDSESDSGPEDRNEPPAKASKSAGSGARKLKNDEGSTYFDLGGNRRVTIREFKGKVFVDIREYYEKDGKHLPGKKGIALNPSQWIKVKSLFADIDDEVQNLA